MKGLAVIAHRGASAHAPENTLAAFLLAAEMGASFIETDLRYSRDGKLVLMHDSRVSRTTNGRGRVAQLELSALRRLDAGSWFGQQFAGERIPTLQEALNLAKELGLGIYLEMKVALDAALLFALVRQLRQFQLDRFVLLSFQPSALRALRAAEPRLKTALLVRRASPAVPIAAQAGAHLLAPHRKRVTAPLIAQAHRAGLEVVTWTVNGRRAMSKLLDMGIDGIMTNWPDRLTQLVREKEFSFRLSPTGHDSAQPKIPALQQEPAKWSNGMSSASGIGKSRRSS